MAVTIDTHAAIRDLAAAGGAGPAAGFLVRGVVLRAAAIAFVLACALQRRGDGPDGGYHRRGPAAVR